MLTDYAKRQLRNRDRCMVWVRDSFGCAIAFKMPSSYLQRRLRTDVYGSRHYKNLNSYYRGYIDGIIESRYDDIWHHQLTWQLYNKTTQQHEDSDTFTQYHDADGNLNIDESRSRHVWTTDKEREW
jgi:hypothetical protein